MKHFSTRKETLNIFRLALFILLAGFAVSKTQAQTNVTLLPTQSWTVPAGVTSATFYLWGGGGAGAATYASPNCYHNGGGGGGGACVSAVVTVVPGQVYTFTGGAGGVTNPAGATPAGSGGTTTFAGPAGTWTAGGGAGAGATLAGGNQNNPGGLGSTVGSGPGATVRAGGNGSSAANGGPPANGCVGATRSGSGGGGGGSSNPGSNALLSCSGAGGAGGTGTFPGGNGGYNSSCGASFTDGPGSANGPLAGAVFGGGGAGAYNYFGTTQLGGAGGAGRVIVSYGAPACTGAPTPGNTIASISSGCTGDPVNLSLQNFTSGTGVTYQWQSSPNGSLYSNIGGATTSTYSTTLGATIFFQCIVNCAGGGSGTSTPVQVVSNGSGLPQTFAQAAFPPCGWTNANAFCLRDNVSAFGIGNGSAKFDFYNATSNINLTSPTFTPTISGTTLTFDFAYSAYNDGLSCNDFVDELRIRVSSDGGSTYTAIEQFLGGTSPELNPFGLCNTGEYTPTSTQWSSKSVSLPAGTNRIQLRGIANLGNNLYLDNIALNVPQPCSGLPAPGNTVASANNQCNGTSIDLSLPGLNNATGYTYAWQTSPDNIAAYSNIAGATNATLTFTPSATAYYRCRVTCTNGNQAANSTPLQVVVQTCIIMVDGLTTNACSGTFYDGGGPSGNYGNNNDRTTTICPSTAGAALKVTFNNFDTETGWDPLYIYDGPTNLSPLFNSGNGTSNSGFPAGGYWGTANPGGAAGFVSTDPTGCLTFRFMSDPSVVNPGWAATVSCIAPCSGTPTPGTTTVSAGSPFCPATSFTLSIPGASVGGGITYQWQTSPNNSTWTNATGAGNTSVTYTTTESVTTWYRCVVKCTNSNLSAPSSGLQVLSNPDFTNCYCSAIPTSTIDEEIYRFFLNGVGTPAAYSGGTNGCNNPAPGPGSILNRYSNFKTLGPLTNLLMGTPSTFQVNENECDGATFFDFGTAIWIDYNHNGSFADAGEKVFVENAVATGPRQVTGSFTVPTTALPGTTGVRVIVAEGFSGAGLTPCLAYDYGETEDWLVNIIPPNATSNSPICEKDTLKLFSPTSGVSYSWTTTASNGFTSTQQNPIIVGALPSDAGVYTVLVNTGTGSYSASVTVVINPTPTLSASASAPFCEGTQNLNLNATAPGGGTFAWTGPGGYSASVEDPIRTSTTASMSGVYSVKVTNANGCTNTATTNVTIYALPSIGIVVIGRLETHLCTGDTSVLQGTGAGVTGTYLWSTAQTGNNIIITAGGTYSVTGTDFHGCSNVNQVTLTQSAPPAAPIVVVSVGDTNLCTSDGVNYASVTLHTTNYNDPNMEWNTGFDFGPDITVNYIYDFNVTIRDAFTCTAVSNVISTHPKIASTAPVIGQLSSSAPGNVICTGPVTLTLTPQTSDVTAPGYLGSDAHWEWFLDGSSCGTGTPVGTGAVITVTPPTTPGPHTYSVRAVGYCNTTTCASIVITVKDPSVDPISSLASPAVICEGSQTTLSVSGGSLGTGASWKLYENTCGGVALQTSSSGSFTVTPQSPGLHTYYIRGEGDCNNTVCNMIVVDVKDSSAQAASLSSSATDICEGTSITMNIGGGHLGRGGVWKWYEGGCGIGAALQSSSSTSLTLTPLTGLHTYYVRAEGDCNNTLCQFVTVNVKDSSEMATSSLASPAVICEGSPTTLSASGGHLGTGAIWKLYENTCGGAALQSSSSPSFILTPQSPGLHTYFIRAEGDCNNTVCNMIVVDVKDSSAQAVSLSSSATDICEGTSITMNIGGGHLGRGGVWSWYEGGCGNGAALQSSSSTSLTLTPLTGLHTYYVRAEGDCNNTLCQFVTVNVKDSSEMATSSLASPAVICEGSPTTLSASGGHLGTGASWKLYENTCGGVALQTSSSPSFTLTPQSPGLHTYFIRAEGDCNNTVCSMIVVDVKDSSAQAVSLSSSATDICEGTSITMNIGGGHLGRGGVWSWYEGGCGNGAALQSSSSASLTITPLTGLHTYYVRAEGDCNNTLCQFVTVNVKDSSEMATSSLASPSVICEGSPTTLSASGGHLGTGASWKLYENTCGGAALQSSSSPSFTLTPQSPGLHTYFIRAEGDCNNTVCSMIVVDVKDSSAQAVSLSSSATDICEGTSITMNIGGGHLGRGAVWSWYEGGCGNGAALQSSSSTSLTITPLTGLHTYYVRAEGDCNNTLCQFVTVNVKDSSEMATSSLASPAVICEGSPTTLSASGGHLGTGASWKLYENTCGGVALQSSSSPSFTLTPQSPGLHTYFIRAEGDCNNTVCSMIVVDVKDSSAQAVSLSSSATDICEGTSITMNIGGGHLGRGAVWSWYEGGCGNGAALQSSSSTSLTLTPLTGLHTYYVRAEGDCNNTLCQFVTVNVKDSSEMATSSLASPAVICEGSQTTLSASGGHLGTGASWKLYENTCGGVALQSSSSPSFTLTPQSPGLHTYFIRAEGDCNNTVCSMIVVDVKDSSAQAVSLSSSAADICVGTSVTMNIGGGHLGRGAVWKWYEGGCGTGAALQSSSSTSFTVTPTPGLHTYYVRAEGDCNTTLCQSVTVNVKVFSVVPVSASASLSTLCAGSQTQLSVSGGSLGTNANWKWYAGSCGGTLVGIGANVTVNVTSTTTYFVRAEGDCNVTPCVSTTVTVNTVSTDPTSATSNAPVNGICIGGSVTLTVSGGTLGTGAVYKWYEDGCGNGASIGTGASITITPAFEGLHSYYVRAEGPCNTTNCAAVSVLVGTYSVAATSITSTVPGNSICVGNNLILTVNGGFLGTVAQWKWYSGSCGGTLVGTGPTITVNPAVTTNYFVRAEGSCNMTTCVNSTVYVSTGPPVQHANIIQSPQSICSGNQGTFNCQTVSNATYYSWSAPNGTTFNGNNPSPYITTVPTVNVTFGVLPNGVSGYDICVFAGNGCGTSATKCKHVNGRAITPQIITGNASSCPNTSSVYSCASSPGADSYLWTITGNATFSNGNDSIVTSGTSVTVNFGSGWTNGLLSVFAQMNCGYQSPAKTITIVSTPVVPGVMSGPSIVCPNGTYTFSIAPVTGATGYNWSTNVPGAVIGAGTTSKSITFPAAIPAGSTVSVTATGSCGTSAPRVKNIATGMANTPGTITGPAAGQCGQTTGYSILPVAGATSYLWTANNGATIVGLNNITSASVAFPVNTTPTTVSVIAINACGNSTPQTKVVTGAPANPGVISNPGAVCVGQTYNYSVPGSTGATSYNWTSPTGSLIMSGQGSATISVLYLDNTGGSVTVNASNACGTSTTSTLAVSVVCRLAQLTNGSLIDATLYPNPTTATTTLKFETITAGDYKVSVVDMTGQIIQTSTITAVEGLNMHELDMSTYAKGLYMVRLEREGEAMQMLRLTVE